MSELQQLSLSETIAKVDALINEGHGDAGRLYHILEFLKNNLPLYHSDKIYLEKKLDSSFSVKDEPQEENTLLPKIKELIDSGNGDLGRLQFIYDAVSNDKPLYRSDSIYLESKLNSSPPQEIVEAFDDSPRQEIVEAFDDSP
ncbi:MAG: chromosome segregation protein SMC, partial [Nitrosopumilus sp.]